MAARHTDGIYSSRRGGHGEGRESRAEDNDCRKGAWEERDKEREISSIVTGGGSKGGWQESRESMGGGGDGERGRRRKEKERGERPRPLCIGMAVRNTGP